MAGAFPEPRPVVVGTCKDASSCTGVHRDLAQLIAGERGMCTLEETAKEPPLLWQHSHGPFTPEMHVHWPLAMSQAMTLHTPVQPLTAFQLPDTAGLNSGQGPATFPTAWVVPW